MSKLVKIEEDNIALSQLESKTLNTEKKKSRKSDIYNFFIFNEVKGRFKCKYCG